MLWGSIVPAFACRKDDDDDENDPAQLALSFLPNKRQKRHRFFNERKMAVVECF